MDHPLSHTQRSIDRLRRHAAEVLARMDRGVLQAKVSSGEMDRLLDKREAYRLKVHAELEFLAERLQAQARHQKSLDDPNRKAHKKRGNRVVVERTMRRFPMR